MPVSTDDAPSPTSSVAHAAVTTDVHELAREKADRSRRYDVWQVPALRLVGFAILTGAVVISHASSRSAPWTQVVTMAFTFLGYSLGSWLAIAMGYARYASIGQVFLAVDPFVWMFAVHVTGGADSWLYFLPLVRVADQLNTTRQRALCFTAVAVAAYVLLLGYEATMAGQDVSWSVQSGRIAFLAGCGAYLAATAGTADRLRTQLADAVRRARDSVRELQRQSVLLEEARRAAVEASHAKTSILANVSHEFRTPLNAIIGYSELLHDELRTAPASVHADLGRICRSAERLRHLVNDVLALSQSEPGSVAVAMARISVDALVDEVAAATAGEVRSNGNSLVTKVDPSAVTIVTDGAKLSQVLTNLVGNAAKFTQNGRIELCVDRTEVAGGSFDVVFTVTDTGEGMSQVQLDRIRRCEPFVQADASMTRRHGGTGLGLAVCHRFVSLLGGVLTMDSAPGHGTVVTVRIPVVTQVVDEPIRPQTERQLLDA